MPKLQPEDPKTLRSLLEKYGTLDVGIDPDEIGELLDQADEEIREADWDLKGKFPNGVLKSAEMAILRMALALALGYCRRLARRDEFDPAKGARAHRNAALLLVLGEGRDARRRADRKSARGCHHCPQPLRL